jgi:hypothetical protein
VIGLPSDIPSDYLSLWGVGTLFGKTLDVDMAYTRKNKVLRTKIGCLDRTLIPTHSEMFIRRGFYKLHFEVEPTNGSQEMNMVEAYNGDDGHDDANNGEESHDGGNAMDMDPNGVDEGNKSNNVDKEMTNEKSGAEGMQVQSSFVEDIQIGTMKLSISPKGTLDTVKNSNQKELFFKPILHDLNLLLDDNLCTKIHADYLARGSTSGLS